MVNRFHFRPRPRRRKIHWRGWINECSYYAVFGVVAVQGMRLLIRPTLIDGVVFIAAIFALLPSVC